MRVWLLVSIVAALSTFGCKINKVQGHGPPPAYMDPAGAQDAMRQAQMVVQVRGDVRNRVVPWNGDLTLAAALVEADYIGRLDPLSVTVTRARKVYRFSTSRLLSGGDMFLEPGDVIDIHR
ncbi:MAG TPA: hypothetical protein VJ063_18150 [Verrucomicrobiae bacterium]|nr:hypothetical protein [Verrucomicrobiae bacterium]